MNIWDLFECLETYKKIIIDEEHGEERTIIFSSMCPQGVKYHLLLELWLV
jgi:hypothetical protein